MHIMVACGGTGGHIMPGLATAEALLQRDCRVTLLLAGKPVENTALSQWPGPVITVPSRGLGGRSPLELWRTARQIWRACRRCTDLLRPAPPDALLAMGCYASVAPVWAAHRLRVPVVLHESNVVPGRAVRRLAAWADVVALAFEEAAAYLGHPRPVVTGMPLRRTPESAEEPDWSGALAKQRFTLLVMGGSGGARHLNQTMPETAAELCRRGHPLQVIHLSGVAEEQAVARHYQSAGVPAVVRGFMHGMPAAYRRADLAVCRAGAATCAELAMFGVPALLVPYPHAAADHQTANARALARRGAARLWPQNECTPVNTAAVIEAIMRAPDVLDAMRASARAGARPDAADKLAALVLSAAAAKHAGAAQ